MIAYSGSHGTGKSDSAYRLVRELKRNYPTKAVIVLADLEAFCPYPINQGTSEEAQAWLFANQIRREMEALNSFDVVVTDRTLVDIVAYTFAAGFQSLATGQLAYAEQHVSFYSEINFKKICFNPYCHNDGIRDADDMEFRQRVEDIMLSFHEQLLDPSVFPGVVHYA